VLLKSRLHQPAGIICLRVVGHLITLRKPVRLGDHMTISHAPPYIGSQRWEVSALPPVGQFL